ncbi:MAG TPA: LTA synthase family protein [Leucothrix sp.]|nr:LTA synthase family protein [Leucothrix sp.]
MIDFLTVLLFTVVASFLPERLLKPTSPKVTFSNIFQQAFIISFLFLCLTLIVQRPVFSGIAILIFLIIMLGVSNAKNTALHEPMVFSDFAMFSQAFKHPRLYFPFLGLAPVIIMPLLIVGLIILVLTLEPAMAFTWQRILATVTTLLILFFIIKSKGLSSILSLDPATDNSHFGLINSVIAYFFQARTVSHQEKIKLTLRRAPFYAPSAFSSSNKSNDKQKQANITVIQSESFFDARQLHPSIKQEVLKNFDACNAESLQYGKLKVPAWGANTMRTEFSFLTGLAYEDLGFYRYYPYEFLSEMSITSIASALQQRGYYCVCIHPHPASFFGRDKIFPQMGFDEFIDNESFDESDTFGPYISDEAVTQKILKISAEKTDKPLFIFVITMENHGPLHLEKVTQEEHSDFFNQDDKTQHLDELAIYLRHLKNADKMIKTLTQAYKKADAETTLCFYGDHIPSMPKTYQATDYNDSHSNYFIWNSKCNLPKKKNAEKSTEQKKEVLSVETLAMLLIDS